MKTLAALVPTMLLAACAAHTPAPYLPDGDMPQVCDAAPAQYHIGHQATADMGAAIQKDAHAATLRWGPPDSAWTMDMRNDRVNVRYDAQMTITEITCG